MWAVDGDARAGEGFAEVSEGGGRGAGSARADRTWSMTLITIAPVVPVVYVDFKK